jgi:hypothetical protein
VTVARTSTLPLTLRVATGLAVMQTVGESIAIGWRDELKWPLRIALILVICTQIVFAAWARRYSPGAAFGLFAYQIATVVVAVASSAAPALRALLAASAVATFVLLAASLSAFPSADVRMSSPRGPSLR